MTSTTQGTATGTERSARAQKWFLANAVVAWAGLAIQLTISATGMYPTTATKPSQYGYGNLPGLDGLVGRLVDFFSYFTIWSNIAVAVVVTLLALDARRDSPVLRAVRLSSLLMISITGLVYGVILSGVVTLRGWEYLANFFIHQAVPLLTVVVFVVAGPRGWIDRRVLLGSFVLPILWLAYALIRGAVIGAYPYFFIDVATLGYGTVALNLTGVLVLGLVIALLLWWLDRWLVRRAAARTAS